MESQISDLYRDENLDLNFEKQEELLVCVVEWSLVWSVLLRERERERNREREAVGALVQK